MRSKCQHRGAAGTVKAGEKRRPPRPPLPFPSLLTRAGRRERGQRRVKGRGVENGRHRVVHLQQRRLAVGRRHPTRRPPRHVVGDAQAQREEDEAHRQLAVRAVRAVRRVLTLPLAADSPKAELLCCVQAAAADAAALLAGPPGVRIVQVLHRDGKQAQRVGGHQLLFRGRIRGEGVVAVRSGGLVAPPVAQDVDERLPMGEGAMEKGVSTHP